MTTDHVPKALQGSVILYNTTANTTGQISGARSSFSACYKALCTEIVRAIQRWKGWQTQFWICCSERTSILLKRRTDRVNLGKLLIALKSDMCCRRRGSDLSRSTSGLRETTVHLSCRFTSQSQTTVGNEKPASSFRSVCFPEPFSAFISRRQTWAELKSTCTDHQPAAEALRRRPTKTWRQSQLRETEAKPLHDACTPARSSAATEPYGVGGGGGVGPANISNYCLCFYRDLNCFLAFSTSHALTASAQKNLQLDLKWPGPKAPPIWSNFQWTVFATWCWCSMQRQST